MFKNLLLVNLLPIFSGGRREITWNNALKMLNRSSRLMKPELTVRCSQFPIHVTPTNNSSGNFLATLCVSRSGLHFVFLTRKLLHISWNWLSPYLRTGLPKYKDSSVILLLVLLTNLAGTGLPSSVLHHLRCCGFKTGKLMLGFKEQSSTVW